MDEVALELVDVGCKWIRVNEIMEILRLVQLMPKLE
jgi:hypothetical protein